MIKKLFRNFAKTDNSPVDLSRVRDRLASSRPYTLTVHQGYGGTAIEVEQYDVSSDKFHRALYVIADGQDLAEEISRILMVEQLKK